MAGVVLVAPKFQFLDAVGNPLANGSVDVFLAGTTTRTSSWQDQAQTTLNTNPIILDSNGSCTMFVDSMVAYKLVVKNAAGVTQPHIGGDNIRANYGGMDNVVDYTALRAYTSSATALIVTGYSASSAPSGIAGTFVRDDADTVSTDDGGTVIVASNGKRWKRAFNGAVNVRWFGAKGDNVTDDTSAFTAAISAMALRKGGTLFIPVGTYKVTSTIDFSALNQFALVGEGHNHGQTSVGAQITGNFAGPLVKYVTGGTGCSFVISQLRLNQSSTNVSSSVIQCSGFIGGAIENCHIAGGHYGIFCDQNNFTLAISQCVIRNSFAANPTGIGVAAQGHTKIDTCDITGWGEGIRASNSTVDVTGCRLEINSIALNVGVAADGTTVALARSNISGNSFEANDIAIKIVSASNCTFQAMGIQGSVGAPSGQSQIGISLLNCSFCSFAGLQVGGSHSSAGILVTGGTGRSANFSNVSVSNSFGGTSRAWDVKSGLGTAGALNFYNTNYTVRPDDTVVNGNSVRHGQVQYLAQIDYMNSNVEGKNLRGKNISLGSGVTTKAIAFTGAGHDSGSAALSAVAAAVTGGATLAAGTYFYCATAVTAHGECAALNEMSVVVGGANNSVNITLFGMTADGFKRRIYRGTQSGVYDGYFETTLNPSATFADIGQAFTGRKSPPSPGVDDTSMLEPDANYAVVVTPSWLTTFRVTSKATTGFTVDFGTATPDANQTIDWVLIR